MDGNWMLSLGFKKINHFQITLVSVMGPSGSGKRFLMSFLTGGKKGKQIRNANERHTEGIWIFMYPMVSDDGSHAIFFLETQGTFDLQTDRNVSAWIVGFSLLISDVQILNLRGNFGGDDLHDLHMFVESAAAFGESELAKSLIFVVRDAPHWREGGGDFLEKLWAENEKSKDMKDICESLRNHFPNEIDCICVAPASDRVRRATENIDFDQEDFNLHWLYCLEELRELVYQKCQSASKAQHGNLISLAKKIVKYFENEAPELKSSVQVIQEATVIQAVNKAYEVFHKAIKDATSDTIAMAEELGKAEVKTKLKSMLMNEKHLIAEAHELLNPKIEKMLTEKRQEDQITNEKRILREAETFAFRWRSKIQRITHLKDALELKKDRMIEKEATAITIPLAIRHPLEEALEARLVTLKSQFIKTRLNELDNELRLFLLTSDFDEIPDEDWIKAYIDSLLERFQEECNTNAIEEAQFKLVKKEIRANLEKTGFNCRNITVSKMLARKAAEEMEARMAANAQDQDPINNFNSDCDSISLNEDYDDKGVLEAKKPSSPSFAIPEKLGESQNMTKINFLDGRDDFQASGQSFGQFYSIPTDLDSERRNNVEKSIKERIEKARRRLEEKQKKEQFLQKQNLSQAPLASTITTHLHASGDSKQEPNAYDRPASNVSFTEDAHQSDFSEYDEISDTAIDSLVPKHIEAAAIAEMNHKFQVLKMILEKSQNLPNQAEIREHFIGLYTEFATWCEVRIDASVVMYFVNKFHDECQTYIFEQYGLKIEIKQYEEEFLRRTENPNWTDAQKLKRKVLKQRGKQPHKKKLGKERVESLFSELMQENIEMTKHSGITQQRIWSLIECSKSKFNFFISALQKYDKHNDLPRLLNKILVKKWLEFLYFLPKDGFDEEATVDVYLNVCQELNLQVPKEKHASFLYDVHEISRLKREEEQRQKRYYDAAQSRQFVEQQRYLYLPDAASRSRRQGQRTFEPPHPKPSPPILPRQQPMSKQSFDNLEDQASTAHPPFH